jgi:hypothetical protein
MPHGLDVWGWPTVRRDKKLLRFQPTTFRLQTPQNPSAPDFDRCVEISLLHNVSARSIATTVFIEISVDDKYHPRYQSCKTKANLLIIRVLIHSFQSSLPLPAMGVRLQESIDQFCFSF